MRERGKSNGFLETPLRDQSVGDWLRNQVAPTFDAMLADPSRGIPAEPVFNEIRKHHCEIKDGLADFKKQ